MKIKILGLFLILLTPLTLFSCRSSRVVFPNRPESHFRQALSSASPDFKQGWEDGCEVGMSAGSNSFYKMFYNSNKIDGYKSSSSAEYRTAYSKAFFYCYRHDYIKQKSSIWGSMFGGYK